MKGTRPFQASSIALASSNGAAALTAKQALRACRSTCWSRFSGVIAGASPSARCNRPVALITNRRVVNQRSASAEASRDWGEIRDRPTNRYPRPIHGHTASPPAGVVHPKARRQCSADATGPHHHRPSRPRHAHGQNIAATLRMLMKPIRATDSSLI